MADTQLKKSDNVPYYIIVMTTNDLDAANNSEYSEIFEEVEALKAIYCKEGEFLLTKLGGNDFVITITVPVDAVDYKTKPVPVLEISLIVNNDYPRCKPSLSLKCNRLVNDKIAQLKASCLAHFEADEYTNQAVLLDIIQWLEQNVLNFISSEPDALTSDSESANDCRNVTVLIQLDHMRSKKAYCDTLLNWWGELNISGRVVFYCSYIFLVIQGSKSSIKEYLMRHRTSNVNIDKRGRACKERLLSILAEQDLVADSVRFLSMPAACVLSRLCDAQVVECSDKAQLIDLFERLHLSHLFPVCLANIR